MLKKYVLLVSLCVIPLANVAAQGNGPDRPGRGNGVGPRPDRALMEQRFKERSAQIVKERLGLNDDQMSKLQALNSRMEEKRRPVFQREFQVRRELRAELDASSPDQGKIDNLLNETLKLQEQKSAIFREEQKEMAKFLTPAQRAQYFGLQNQIRERIERAYMEGGGARKGGRGPNGPGGEMGGPGAPPEPFMPLL